jgi:hypothetical protein
MPNPFEYAASGPNYGVAELKVFDRSCCSNGIGDCNLIPLELAHSLFKK